MNIDEIKLLFLFFTVSYYEYMGVLLMRKAAGK